MTEVFFLHFSRLWRLLEVRIFAGFHDWREGGKGQKASKPRDRYCPGQTVIPPLRGRSPVPRYYLEYRGIGLRGCHKLRHFLAGPNSNTQALDLYSGRSTDTAVPATNSTGRPSQFHCEYSRVIRQAIQLHQRRWTRKETALLARWEAVLTIRGVWFINQALLQSFP